MKPNMSQLAGGLGDAFGQSDMVVMSHQFKVLIDSGKYDLGSWSKVSGLAVNWTPCTYRAGEDKDGYDVMVFPGNARFGTIKLSRGACRDSQEVQNWLRDTATKHEALTGEIRMVNSLQMVVVSWPLRAFYPIGWSIDTLAADNSRAVVETLELAHSGFLVEKVGPGVSP